MKVLTTIFGVTVIGLVLAFLCYVMITGCMYSFYTPPFTVSEAYTLNPNYSCGENVLVKLLDVIKDTEGKTWGIAYAQYVYLKVQQNNGDVIYIKLGGIGGGDGCTEEEDIINKVTACRLSK